jgi:hypothetical protein
MLGIRQWMNNPTEGPNKQVPAYFYSPFTTVSGVPLHNFANFDYAVSNSDWRDTIREWYVSYKTSIQELVNSSFEIPAGAQSNYFYKIFNRSYTSGEPGFTGEFAVSVFLLMKYNLSDATSYNLYPIIILKCNDEAQAGTGKKWKNYNKVISMKFTVSGQTPVEININKSFTRGIYKLKPQEVKDDENDFGAARYLFGDISDQPGDWVFYDVGGSASSLSNGLVGNSGNATVNIYLKMRWGDDDGDSDYVHIFTERNVPKFPYLQQTLTYNINKVKDDFDDLLNAALPTAYAPTALTETDISSFANSFESGVSASTNINSKMYSFHYNVVNLVDSNYNNLFTGSLYSPLRAAQNNSVNYKNYVANIFKNDFSSRHEMIKRDIEHSLKSQARAYKVRDDLLNTSINMAKKRLDFDIGLFEFINIYDYSEKKLQYILDMEMAKFDVVSATLNTISRYSRLPLIERPLTRRERLGAAITQSAALGIQAGVATKNPAIGVGLGALNLIASALAL